MNKKIGSKTNPLIYGYAVEIPPSLTIPFIDSTGNDRELSLYSLRDQ